MPKLPERPRALTNGLDDLIAPSPARPPAPPPKPTGIKFSVAGADPVKVKWLRVLAAQEETTIGELFNEAMDLLQAQRGSAR